MSDNWHAKGPVVVWVNYGAHEGWAPRSYATVKEGLLETERGFHEFVVTRVVEFDVVEVERLDPQGGEAWVTGRS